MEGPAAVSKIEGRGSALGRAGGGPRKGGEEGRGRGTSEGVWLAGAGSASCPANFS